MMREEVISDPQRRLYNKVKSLYNESNVIFNHPVYKATVDTLMWVLVDRMISFDFDVWERVN